MGNDKDNPFGDPGDGERTVIRPSPGRRPAAPPPAAPRAAPPAPEPAPVRLAESIALPSEGVNPVVGAASVLLALTASLRRATQQQNVSDLRQRVIGELKNFEHKIRALSLSANALKGAHYVVCATIDDIVLNTPWGSHSLWTSQSLVSTFHNEVTGGERFFDILNALQSDPGRNIDVLELMYVCLALGFEGKYRIGPRGATELARLQEGLYRQIRQTRGEFERELSPSWRGVPAPHRTLASYLPVWVVAVVAGVAVLVIYMGLSFALGTASDPVFSTLAQLPPRDGVTVANAAPPPPPVNPPKPKFLAPEVAEGLVTVQETGQKIVVTLRATGMFPSGSATVEPRYATLLRRIGDEIEKETGKVQVLGHTDNVPIRTIRFPSNFELSLARAKAAATIISTRLTKPERVSAEGRADADPVAPNTTASGREANRRIEIVILKGPKA